MSSYVAQINIVVLIGELKWYKYLLKSKKFNVFGGKMEITNFIYHGVEKEQGKDSKITDLFELSDLIEVKEEDTKLLNFLDKVRGKYNKTGPSYGQLIKDEDANFTKYLNKYIAKEIDFLIFSQKVFGLISTEIERTATATGGIILFLEYKQLQKNKTPR